MLMMFRFQWILTFWTVTLSFSQWSFSPLTHYALVLHILFAIRVSKSVRTVSLSYISQPEVPAWKYYLNCRSIAACTKVVQLLKTDISHLGLESRRHRCR